MKQVSRLRLTFLQAREQEEDATVLLKGKESDEKKGRKRKDGSRRQRQIQRQQVTGRASWDGQ